MSNNGISIEQEVMDDYLRIAVTIEKCRKILNEMEGEDHEPADYENVYNTFMNKRDELQKLIREKL